MQVRLDAPLTYGALFERARETRETIYFPAGIYKLGLGVAVPDNVKLIPRP